MPNNRKIIPENAPFSSQEAEWLDHFFTQMSTEQATWLNGFVSGFQALQLSGSTANRPNPMLGTPSKNPVNRTSSKSAVFEKPTLMILYGSESGNAEGLAADAKKRAGKLGIKATLVDMADSNPTELTRENNVLVVISTWGEGDPPERATLYYQQIMGADAPQLEGLNFGVLALGDTSYEQFCQMGKDFDKRLEELGATRVIDRVDCDVDYEESAEKWVESALDKISTLQSKDESSDIVFEVQGDGSAQAKPTPAIEYGKKNPFPLLCSNGWFSTEQAPKRKLFIWSSHWKALA